MVFTFKGQLDAFSEKQFKSFVANNLKNDLPFVIDLTKIDFLDSSGLEHLFKLQKNAKSRNLGSLSLAIREWPKQLNLFVLAIFLT